MAEGFQVARLIPVSGIANSTEAEMRATSALLSVLTIVRDLSVAMLSPLGASTARKATVEAFIETSFKLNGSVVRPDGLVHVRYGSSSWKALVEVKTGANALDAEQVTNYLAVAREQGIDAVVTVSNEIGVGAEHPCDGVRHKANAKVRLAHWSWTEILAHSVRAKVHRGVSDPEQAWILGELIRYLEHPQSGAMDFADMGPHWVAARDGARAGTLRKTSPELRDLVSRWDQMIRFTALQLGARTGVDVQPVVPRAHADPKARFGYLADQMTTGGLLDATVRVPGSAGDIRLAADLRARQLAASTEVAAPTNCGNRARISWLLRQLRPETPEDLIVEAWPRSAREPLSATLAGAREERDLLLDPAGKDILRFRLIRRAEMGQQRKDGGRSPGFVQSVTGLADTFYATVLQQITPWIAKPPQARPVAPPKDLVDEPIAGTDDLTEAMGAARDNAGDETGDHPPRTLTVTALDPAEPDPYVEAPLPGATD